MRRFIHGHNGPAHLGPCQHNHGLDPAARPLLANVGAPVVELKRGFQRTWPIGAVITVIRRAGALRAGAIDEELAEKPLAVPHLRDIRGPYRLSLRPTGDFASAANIRLLAWIGGPDD